MTKIAKIEQSTDSLSIVQTIDWRASGDFSDLYFRNQGAEISDSEILLPNGATLDFNTYFGSFYEDYWSRHTSVKRVAIRFLFSGSLKVTVYREDIAKRGKLIHEHNLTSAIESEVQLDLAAPSNRPGRIYFEVCGTEGGGRLLKAEFVALDSPARQEVSLSIGICTFNREIQLTDNLKRLFACEAACKTIRRLIIVNQGERFSNESERIIAASPVEIQLLEQDNQGGTGGFARTMKEAAQKEDFTHHVLMDDDIKLDPEVFTRTAQFLAFADKKVVIGGTLFNSEQPNMCYEAGVKVRKSGEFRLLAHNRDLTDSDMLSVFNRETNTPDYNGWWYSAIPIKAIRTVPHPLSLFIKWDDIEFGLSLGQRGFITVCVPRVAVWHPPFNSMPEGWKAYYFTRNRLITSALHPDKMKLPSRLRVFFWTTVALGKMDYHTAALLKLAIEDFLAGPENLMSTPLQDIQDRVAQAAEFSSAKKLSLHEMPEQQPDTSVVTIRFFRRWLRDTITAVTIATNLFRHRRKVPAEKYIQLLEMENWNVFMVGGNPYFLTNSERDFLWKFSPNPETSRKLLHDCWAVAKLYGKSKRAVAKQWNEVGSARKV